MDTREIVTRYFDAVNDGRWDDYLSLFADDVVMDEQLGGHIEGIQAVAQAIEGLRGNPNFHNWPIDSVVEGDRAMARWHIETLGPKGEKIDAYGVNYYQIKDGKIAYFANYHDSRPFKSILEQA